MTNFDDLKNRTGEFLKDVETEIGKITWPMRDDTIKSTIAVVFISGILTLFLFGVDSLFAKIVKAVLT